MDTSAVVSLSGSSLGSDAYHTDAASICSCGSSAGQSSASSDTGCSSSSSSGFGSVAGLLPPSISSSISADDGSVSQPTDPQALALLCKSQKTELSQRLQSLSQSAKDATEYIQGLKQLSTTVGENCTKFEEEVSRQCDQLINAIVDRKAELFAFIRKEKQYKQRTLKEQVSKYTQKLSKTTSLLQFCVEVLKEKEPSAFLQLSSALIQSAASTELAWRKDLDAAPWVSKEFELTLDSLALETAIHQLTFKESVTKPNWLAFDAHTSSADVILSNNNQTASCATFENRLVMTNLAFSTGIHYWEFTIDRYEGNADPAFGIAREGAAKDKMLGKDEFGWSMYIDDKRSWFLSHDYHEHRIDGGIEAGTVIGVLLDLDRGQLSFYVNDEQQGPVAFTGLRGSFYPALSLNRNVQVTIQPDLEPPIPKEPHIHTDTSALQRIH